jgi:hypothetical protein
MIRIELPCLAQKYNKCNNIATEKVLKTAAYLCSGIESMCIAAFQIKAWGGQKPGWDEVLPTYGGDTSGFASFQPV